MSKTPQTVKNNILKKIYFSGTATASNIDYSNANQYLIEMEQMELIIREWVTKGKRRFKEARINPKKINEVKNIIGA